MNTRKFPLALATLAVLTSVASPAQTAPAKPATTAHKPSATGTAAKKPATAATAEKLPPNIPPAKGIPKTIFALRYIDTKLGTGDLAHTGWKYSVHYTGWLHDGTKFDSSVDRGTPIEFQQGAHRVIVGWDEGFQGMKVGGKRRLLIPWQLAYGETGRGPIPAKADLIFDIEFVAQSDPNAQPPAAPQSATPPPSSPTPSTQDKPK